MIFFYFFLFLLVFCESLTAVLQISHKLLLNSEGRLGNLLKSQPSYHSSVNLRVGFRGLVLLVIIGLLVYCFLSL